MCSTVVVLPVGYGTFLTLCIGVAMLVSINHTTPVQKWEQPGFLSVSRRDEAGSREGRGQFDDYRYSMVCVGG